VGIFGCEQGAKDDGNNKEDDEQTETSEHEHLYMVMDATCDVDERPSDRLAERQDRREPEGALRVRKFVGDWDAGSGWGLGCPGGDELQQHRNYFVVWAEVVFEAEQRSWFPIGCAFDMIQVTIRVREVRIDTPQ
jgi:hypothetical protein